jgi:hypothetical protein
MQVTHRFQGPVANGHLSRRSPVELTIAIMTTIILSGCATAPDSIVPAHVSQDRYKALDCDQLTTERKRVEASLSDARAVQGGAAANDVAAVALAIALLPVAIVGLGGYTAIAGDLARLRGERIAISEVMETKGCPPRDSPRG